MPDGYLGALQWLALALADHYARTGDDAVLEGAAAVALYTADWFPSGDFDNAPTLLNATRCLPVIDRLLLPFLFERRRADAVPTPHGGALRMAPPLS